MISDMTLMAISSGVRPPMSSPIGALIRRSSSGSKPLRMSSSKMRMVLRLLPRRPTYDAGVFRAPETAASSN